MSEARVLEDRKPLVVVHREHGILVPGSRCKGGIGRQWAAQVQALVAQALQ